MLVLVFLVGMVCGVRGVLAIECIDVSGASCMTPARCDSLGRSADTQYSCSSGVCCLPLTPTEIPTSIPTSTVEPSATSVPTWQQHTHLENGVRVCDTGWYNCDGSIDITGCESSTPCQPPGQQVTCDSFPDPGGECMSQEDCDSSGGIMDTQYSCSSGVCCLPPVPTETPSCIASNGDYDGEGGVTISDGFSWYTAYRAYLEDNNNYDVKADFDCDTKVNITDGYIWYLGYKNPEITITPMVDNSCSTGIDCGWCGTTCKKIVAGEQCLNVSPPDDFECVCSINKECVPRKMVKAVTPILSDDDCLEENEICSPFSGKQCCTGYSCEIISINEDRCIVQPTATPTFNGCKSMGEICQNNSECCSDVCDFVGFGYECQ